MTSLTIRLDTLARTRSENTPSDQLAAVRSARSISANVSRLSFLTSSAFNNLRSPISSARSCRTRVSFSVCSVSPIQICPQESENVCYARLQLVYVDLLRLRGPTVGRGRGRGTGVRHCSTSLAFESHGARFDSANQIAKSARATAAHCTRVVTHPGHMLAPYGRTTR